MRETSFSQKDILPPQCLLFLFFKKRNRSPSFLFRRKKRSACTGSAGPQTDGRRHILRCRRSEYHTGMPPSSALSLPVSAAPARQLSRANRPRKRKSSAGKLSFAAPAAFANVLHKTDGSYVNRPVFVAGRTCGKASFLR